MNKNKKHQMMRANQQKLQNLVVADSNIIVHDNFETIQKLVDGYSISRYGDGEIFMMTEQNMVYENYSETLKNRLIEVITQDNSNSKLLIGIPLMFLRNDPDVKYNVKNQTWIRFWNDRIRVKELDKYIKLLNASEYYSSFFTQLYVYDDDYIKKLIQSIKRVWDNKEIVLFMISESKKQSTNVITKLFDNATKINHEIVPPTKAWESYNDIYQRILKYDNTCLILLCCGPTATILANDVTKLNYQAIDFGQFIIGLIDKLHLFS